MVYLNISVVFSRNKLAWAREVYKVNKKILNSVNSEEKYIAIYKNFPKSIKAYHFSEYFLEIVSQVFITREV